MTLFTKTDCRLCDQLKSRFDLAALQVNVEVLDGRNAAALAHLAWHGLVETARKSLPILVLDDSSSVVDYGSIEQQLAERGSQLGLGAAGPAAAAASCESGTCSL